MQEFFELFFENTILTIDFLNKKWYYIFIPKKGGTFMRLVIHNPHLMANLVNAKTNPPHFLKIQTQIGRLLVKVQFVKKYENYTRIEGVIFLDEFREKQQRFSLNLINGAKNAEIDINNQTFWK